MHRRYLLSASLLALMHTSSRASERPLIAAATSLQPALQEAGPVIATQTGIVPRFAYGASGNLARQIAQGAPFELLLAADEASILALAKAGLCPDALVPALLESQLNALFARPAAPATWPGWTTFTSCATANATFWFPPL